MTAEGVPGVAASAQPRIVHGAARCVNWKFLCGSDLLALALTLDVSGETRSQAHVRRPGGAG